MAIGTISINPSTIKHGKTGLITNLGKSGIARSIPLHVDLYFASPRFVKEQFLEMMKSDFDIIIFTVYDTLQKQALENLLDAHISINDETTNSANNTDKVTCPQFYVIEDPPGFKIGAGGSTLHVIWKLFNVLHKDLYEKKILIIHSGGLSQRLPTASILGKLSVALPISGSERRPYAHMLTYLIESLHPLDKRFPPGIVINGSDVLTPFNLGKDSGFNIKPHGFTLIAHESTLDIATTHGVFTLPPVINRTNLDAGQFFYSSKCDKILQKPSIEELHKNNATFVDKGKEKALTDSFFYFGHDVTKKLLEFYLRVKPLTCEICCWGDFQRPLGEKAKMDYLGCNPNAVNPSSSLKSIQKELFDILHETNVDVIVLKKSAFYHIGTVNEYFHLLCDDEYFRSHFTIQQHLCVKFIDDTYTKINEAFIDATNNPLSSIDLKGIILNSILHYDSKSHRRSLIEHCHFDIPIEVEENSIISNCLFSCNEIIHGTGDNVSSISSIIFPPNLIIQTVPVRIPLKKVSITNAKEKNGSKNGFVTFAFPYDLSLKYKVEDLNKVVYFGKSLREIVTLLDLKETNFYDDVIGKYFSEVKLFCAANTAAASLMKSLTFLKRLLSDETCETESLLVGSMSGFSSEELYSFSDLLKIKNASVMLDNQQNLTSIISA